MTSTWARSPIAAFTDWMPPGYCEVTRREALSWNEEFGRGIGARPCVRSHSTNASWWARSVIRAKPVKPALPVSTTGSASAAAGAAAASSGQRARARRGGRRRGEQRPERAAAPAPPAGEPTPPDDEPGDREHGRRHAGERRR